jgi:aldehyde:ferredoxin oxidoreductase
MSRVLQVVAPIPRVIDAANAELLVVDLSARRSERVPFALTGRRLGGASVAVEVLEAAIDGPLDPLSADNAIVFAPGPFAGTAVPAATKHAIATVSPLTGRITDGLSSSHWSAALRGLGLAALVVRGACSEWTMLAIDRDGVRFLDAAGLLGESAAATTVRVRAHLGNQRARVAAIGLAGERGVRYATIDNDGRQAGRGGAGAVMGAKRLKAIALIEGDVELALADPPRVAALANALRERALGPATAKYRVLGTGANMRVLQRMGMLPTRNFGAAHFDGVESVTPERARENSEAYLERRTGCVRCPVQCDHMYVRRGADPARAGAADYESAWAFGPNCGIDDLDAVLDAIVRCDLYGLDTISTGGAIAFAMDCAARGAIDADAFGTPLRFGNAAVLAPAIDAIARGEGLGATLGLGVRAAADAIGIAAADCALHVKGLELPGYEPRALPTYALALAVCTRGACHNRAAAYDLDLRNPGNVLSDPERAAAVVEAEDIAMAWDALVLCKFTRDCFQDFWSEGAALWTAALGEPLDAEGMRATVRATWHRKRALNARLGWTEAEDVLPSRLAEPLRDGSFAGMRSDPEVIERQRRLYERLRAAS